MKKRLISIVICASMVMALSACGGRVANESAAGMSAETEQVISGGWEINQGSLEPEANKEAVEAFRKATESRDGYEYELIAVLGSQVVAGMNYSCLCKGTAVYPDAEAEYLIVNVYQDPEGNAEITGTSELLDIDVENADGGWSYNQGEISVEKNPDVNKAFKDAVEKLDGADYEAVAYIGSQIVAGTNHAIFCSTMPVVPDAECSFCIVIVSQDTEGNAEISEIRDVEIDVQDESVDSAGSQETTQIPNPFSEVNTLAEAAELTGFSITVPDAPKDHPDRIIRVMGSSMIEVIYENLANETEDGTDEIYRIRKAAGDEDISGDYNDYGNIRNESIGDMDVTLKGDGDTVSVATWSADGYSYAIDAQDHPLTTMQIEEIIGAVR